MNITKVSAIKNKQLFKVIFVKMHNSSHLQFSFKLFGIIKRYSSITAVNYARFANKAIKEERNIRKQNPGIGDRAVLFKNDPEFLEQLEGEEDFESLETDFSSVEKSYDDYKREEGKIASAVRKRITYRKFFKEPKQPNMLTWAEKEQIRLLYEKDPAEWNPEKLSQSLPATPEAITKILRRRWIPENIEHLKRKDRTVLKNWKLFEEGKLDADPNLIEHLKKFSNRSETLLEQLKAPGMYEAILPEKKEEPNWNNGKMKSILLNYEKSLKELEIKQGRNLQQISDGKKGEIRSWTQDKVIKNTEYKTLQDHVKFKGEIKSGTQDKVMKSTEYEVLQDHVKFKGEMEEGNDSFTLERIPANGKPLTLSQLQENIKIDHESGKPLDLIDKLLLENSIKEKSTTDNAKNLNKTKLLSLFDDADKLSQHKSTINTTYNLQQNLEQSDSSSEPENNFLSDVNSNLMPEKSKHSFNRIQSDNKLETFHSTQNFSTIEGKNKKEKKISKKIGGFEELFQNKTKDSVEQFKQEAFSKKVLTKRLDKVQVIEERTDAETVMVQPINYDYADPKDKEMFEKEEKSLEDTCFWNSTGKIQKYATPSKTELSKINRTLLQQSYPQRIKVPRNKRGSGQTFKVNDCFYDDDGQFLYRVPGLVN